MLEDSVKIAIKESDLVIKGVILSKEFLVDSGNMEVYIDSTKTKTESISLYTWELTKYKVLIIEKYKGKPNSDTVFIMTGAQGSPTGFVFDIGKTYIIYGVSENLYQKEFHRMKYPEKVKDLYWTNIHFRTRLFNEQERQKLKNE
jgi:hypothetical protein